MLREKSGNMVGEPHSQTLSQKVNEMRSLATGNSPTPKPPFYKKYIHLILSSIRKVAIESVSFARAIFTKQDFSSSGGAAFHEGEIDEEFEDVVKFTIKYAITLGYAYYVQYKQENLKVGDILIPELVLSKAKLDPKYPFKPSGNPWAKLSSALEYVPELLKKPGKDPKVKTIDNLNLVIIKLKEDVNYRLAWKLYRLIYQGDTKSKEKFISILNDKDNSIETWNALYNLVRFLHAQRNSAVYVDEKVEKGQKPAEYPKEKPIRDMKEVMERIDSSQEESKQREATSARVHARERIERILLWMSSESDLEENRKFLEQLSLNPNSTELEEYVMDKIEKVLGTKRENPPKKKFQLISEDHLKFLHFMSKQIWQLGKVGFRRGAIYTTEEAWNSMSELQLAEYLGHEAVHFLWNEGWNRIWNLLMQDRKEVLFLLAKGINGAISLRNDKDELTILRTCLLNYIRLLGYRMEEENFWKEVKEHEFSEGEAKNMLLFLLKELSKGSNDPHLKKEQTRKRIKASEESAVKMEETIRENYKKVHSLPFPLPSLRDQYKSIALSLDTVANSIEKGKNDVNTKHDPTKGEERNLIFGANVPKGLIDFIIKYHISTKKAFYAWKKGKAKDGDAVIPTAEIVDEEGEEKYIEEALKYLEGINEESPDSIILAKLRKILEESNIVVIKTEDAEIKNFRLVWKLYGAIESDDSEGFIENLISPNDSNSSWHSRYLLGNMYQQQMNLKLYGENRKIKQNAYNHLQKMMLWLILNQGMGGEYDYRANIEIGNIILSLEEYKMENVFNSITLDNSDSSEKIRNLAPNFDDFSFADYLRENLDEKVYENEKYIFYDVTFPRLINRVRNKLIERTSERKRATDAQSTTPPSQASIAGMPTPTISTKDPNLEFPAFSLLYHDFTHNRKMWVAKKVSGSRENTQYIPKGLWDVVKENPLALLQLLAWGILSDDSVSAEEMNELILNRFTAVMGVRSKDYLTLDQILEGAHPKIKMPKKELLQSQWLAGGEEGLGVEEAYSEHMSEAERVLNFIGTDEGKQFLIGLGIAESQINFLVGLIKEDGVELNHAFKPHQLISLRERLGLSTKDDRSFYGEEYTENVWLPLLKNLYRLRETNVTVWNSFVSALREVGYGSVVERFVAVTRVDEFVSAASPIQGSFEAMKAVVESAGFIVSWEMSYGSTLNDVKKKMGVDLEVVEVRGPPLPGMKTHSFVTHTVDASGKLTIFIHKDIIDAHRHNLAEFLATVLSHEYLEYLGKSHEEVSEWFSASTLKEHKYNNADEIIEQFKQVRALYLTADRKYGHKDIAAELEKWIVKEKEKTHTLLVPQFLLSSILPVAQRMWEEGKKVEVVNLKGQGWGNVSSEELRNVKTIQTPFTNGKFSLREIQGKVPDLFKDRNVMAVGQGLWADEDLMKELAIAVMTIEFKIGSKMYEFVQDILKRSGMNGKDMKFLLERLSKPISLKSLEKLALQDHEIKAVSVSQ